MKWWVRRSVTAYSTWIRLSFSGKYEYLDWPLKPSWLIPYR
jgi:hypothetical protein